MEMAKDGSITFFIPCLNVGGNVGRVIYDIVTLMKDIPRSYEIIAIDDASMDGTVAEIEGRIAKHPATRIELIKNRFTRGLGRNYLTAAYLARGEYFRGVYGDTDEDPGQIKDNLKLLGQADMIIPYGAPGNPRGRLRLAISKTFTFLVNLIGGHRVRYYNGAVTHKTQNDRDWGSDTSGFGFQAELICRLLDDGKTMLEVPYVNRNPDMGGTAAFRLKNFAAVARSLSRIYRRRFNKRHR